MRSEANSVPPVRSGGTQTTSVTSNVQNNISRLMMILRITVTATVNGTNTVATSTTTVTTIPLLRIPNIVVMTTAATLD